MNSCYVLSTFLTASTLLIACTGREDKALKHDAPSVHVTSPVTMETWATHIRTVKALVQATDDYTPEAWQEEAPFINNKKMINGLLAAVLSGKLQAVRTLEDSNPLTTDEVRQKLNYGLTDTIQVTDPATNETKVQVVKRTPTGADEISSLRFQESWYFDPIGLRIEKDVEAVALLLPSFDERGEYRGEQLLFWIKLPEKRSAL